MRPNQDYVKELERVLTDQFTAFFPAGISREVERETFQSETFQRAGFDTMPDRYGLGDRFLYTTRGEDGRITFVVAGRVSSGNPWEVMHASFPGALDFRKDMTVVYQYDGTGTITETQLRNGERTEYSGQYGNPEALLSSIRQTLGKQVTK